MLCAHMNNQTWSFRKRLFSFQWENGDSDVDDEDDDAAAVVVDDSDGESDSDDSICVV